MIIILRATLILAFSGSFNSHIVITCKTVERSLKLLDLILELLNEDLEIG